MEVLEDEDDEDEEESHEHHPKDESSRSIFHTRENPSCSGESDSRAESSCVMCGKKFKHEMNLRIHLRSHLGLKAILPNCQICKRYGWLIDEPYTPFSVIGSNVTEISGTFALSWNTIFTKSLIDLRDS